MNKGALKLNIITNDGQSTITVLVNHRHFVIVGPGNKTKEHNYAHTYIKMNQDSGITELRVKETLQEIEAMLKIVESVGLPKTLYGDDK